MKQRKTKRKKTINQKVKNATPNIYDGIKFKSKLETYVYKQLKAHNLKAEFVGDNFIIEAKGKPNDVWPYKWKWFMWYLLNKGLAEKYKLFVVHNHKETDECIRRIQEL